MKALKNDCTIYVGQILKEINNCYSDNTPTNNQLMDLYSFIGKYICEQGEKAFVVYLAKQIAEQLPQLKGFSPRNLRRMRDFYITYQSNPMLMEKAQKLSWTQNTVILECCENNEQRSFYLNLAKENNLSKLALMKAIKEETFEQALTVETPIETESNCCPRFANLCNTEDNNTTEHTKNDYRAFVMRCERYLKYCSDIFYANETLLIPSILARIKHSTDLLLYGMFSNKAPPLFSNDLFNSTCRLDGYWV